MATDPLNGMTQAKWDALTSEQRDAIRDNSGLCAQLKGRLGDRVEVTDHYGETRRFWVGVSSGWRPCSLEINNAQSTGGSPAPSRGYATVKTVRIGPRR